MGTRRTNAQIQAEYDKLPVLSKIGTAVADMVGIAGNGISFGGANKLAQMVTGASDQQVAEYERGQRVRAGLAGDVVNVGSMVAGGSGLIRGAMALPNMIRAAPAAARLVPTAGPAVAARFLTGRAGPGLVPVAEKLTRGQKLGTAAKVGGGALLLGASIAGRQDPTDGGAALPEEAPMAAVEEAMASGRTAAPTPITPQSQVMDRLGQLLGSGNMTLTDLQAASGMMPAAPKMPSIKDTIAEKNYLVAQQSAQAQIDAATKAFEAGKITQEQWQAATAKYTDEFLRKGIQIGGGNPVDYAMAPNIPRPEDQL